MNIHKNEYVDEAVKKEIKLKKISFKKYVFLIFIKRKIKKSSLNK